MTKVGFLLAALPAILAAAETIGEPVAGYVPGGASRPELRAILGVPGAFRFSDPIAIPDGVTAIRLGPRHAFALLERGDQAPAAAVLAGLSVDHVVALDGVLPAADWVSLSPEGRTAVLWSASANRLQVVTGLPEAPQVTLDLDTSAFPEPPASAAVSEDGALVLVAGAASVYALSPGAPPRLVLAGSKIQGIAVLRNGKDAVAADAGAGSVSLIQDVAGTAASSVIASGVDASGGIFPSPDGRTLFLAGASGMASVDLVTGDSQFFDCPPAAAFAPLRNRDTFLISAKPGEPAWIFARENGAGRTVFVPAVAVNEEVQ